MRKSLQIKLSLLILFIINGLMVSSYEDYLPKPAPRFSTKVPYSKIPLNQLQERIINEERDMAHCYTGDYHNGIKTFFLRAFTVWAKRYSKNRHLNVNVIKLDPLFLNSSTNYDSAHKFSSCEECAKQYDLNEVVHNKENHKSQYDDYQLVYSSPYSAHTVTQILKKRECIAYFNEYFNTLQPITILDVDIIAIIPQKNKVNKWSCVKFHYTYRLKDKADGDIIKELLDKNNNKYLMNRYNNLNFNDIRYSSTWELYTYTQSEIMTLELNPYQDMINAEELYVRINDLINSEI